MSNVGKFCIFCGEKPKNKNKEHVIPKWLIRMTGEETRNIALGTVITYDEIQKENFLDKFIQNNKRQFSINNFTFPSCELCNSEFSKLEENSKMILEKIINEEEINSLEMSIFLDWMDKIRIGIWLAYYTLDKNPGEIEPKFYIKQRISQYDRILHISKSKESDRKGINFYGVNHHAFVIRPSAFGLSINNYCFINISSNHLLSRRMGFPFPKKEVLTKEFHIKDVYKLDMNEEGLRRILNPIFKKKININGIEFFQSIFREGLVKPINETDSMISLYSSEYVKSNSLEKKQYSKLISNLSDYKFINNNENFKIQPRFTYDNHIELMYLTHDCVLDIQEYMDKEGLNNLKFDSTYSKEERQYIISQFKISIEMTKNYKKLCKIGRKK